MKLTIGTPIKALNKAYLKQSLKREQIELFKLNLARMFERIRTDEHEEHLKNIVSDFLKDTWYKQTNEINTSGRADLAIHNGTTSSASVGVLIEVKRPGNKNEMITPERPNAKALHELLHYYMQERYIKDNKEIKRLIVCNIHEWYIFDAADFERFFFDNQRLIKSYRDWNDGLLVNTNTDWFYQEIAKPFVEKELEELPCTYFNLKDYERIIRNPAKAEDSKLIALYKVLSPPHLLKQTFANDSNSLNREFYNELLHILGLEEVKQKGKKLIRRKPEGSRNDGSLLENTCNFLKTRGRLSTLPDLPQYGADDDERCFSVALELCITWLNRLLFLKLLEGQLIGYHKGDRGYAFLNSSRIKDFDELNELFFEVLAVRIDQRSESVRSKFGAIPYLNSSLFEESDLERATMRINELKNRLDLPLHSATVLKSASGKRLAGSKSTLGYLFEFLDAYDFGAEGGADIQEQNKSIINAAVLGLIFEKINGYKDGSFFTPGFITMYICRESIRRAVIRAFNEAYGWSCASLTELHNDLYRHHIPAEEANKLVNSLKICDPAVGSGHFLVSALNEIIAIKSGLGILADSRGKLLRCDITIENDELIVTVDDGIFEYNYKDAESQRVQETLFHEKETIIENCLFGVDINPKSVAICRLRLWIELLKSAYYRVAPSHLNSSPQQTQKPGLKGEAARGEISSGRDLTEGRELETLPNIDINIKCGNSLVSRFALGGSTNMPAVSRNRLKELTGKYRRHVFEYKLSPANKAQLRKVIADLKRDLENFGLPNDRDLIALRKKENEVAQLGFGFDKKGAEARRKLLAEVDLLQERFAEKERLLYNNAFEWRFEFPEVLDENGEFTGFDMVIGNPPYIRQEAIKEQKPVFLEMFGDFYCGTADIYTYFYKTGLSLLKTGATLCYIAPNKFMRAGYGKNTRELLTTLAKPLMALDFGDLPVFDEATTYPSIVMVEKTPPSPPLHSGGKGKKPSLSRQDRNESCLPQQRRTVEGDSSQEKKLFIPQSVPLPLLEAARTLRSNMTDAEQLLWGCLRRKQLDGYRFRRQHPIERFVLDFYCSEAKLAVELDGGQHNEPDARLHDQERTALLESHGIQVIRFWNNDVFTNTEGVLEAIYLALQQKRPLPNPPPPGEGILNRSAQATEGTLNRPSQSTEAILIPSPQRGEVGRGETRGEQTEKIETFLAATFTNSEQLTRFDETLAAIGFNMPVAALRSEGWSLERPDVLALTEKLRKTGKPLGEYVNGKFYYGIKTGLNEAFVIDEETRQRLIAQDPKCAEIIKPWLRGRDIRKWQAQWALLYVLFTRRGIDIENYPAIKQYLEPFRENLEPKKSDADKHGRKPGSYKWYEIQDNIAYFEEFDRPKIIWSHFAIVPEFVYDEKGFLSNDKSYILPTDDLSLLGILNSKVTNFFLSQLSPPVRGGFMELRKIYLEQLPIPHATNTQQALIIALVRKILALKAPLPTSPRWGEELKPTLEPTLAPVDRVELTAPPCGGDDIYALEAEVDRLVYALYDLTEEEIAVVEGKR